MPIAMFWSTETILSKNPEKKQLECLIGLAMYPVFLEANAVCGELGVCKKTVVSTPTCDECVGSVVLVSEVIKSDAKIAAIVAFLQV